MLETRYQPLESLHTSKEVKTTGLENVPAEKLAAWQAFAAKLHKKYPKWSASRVQRKTCEYFKIKLT